MAATSNPTANRLALLAKDAEQAVEYLDALTAIRGAARNVDPRGTLHSALMHAAIVVYARSFKTNKVAAGEADQKADLGQLQVSQDADLMALHNRIIDARDTMIAHSDWSKRRSKPVFKAGDGSQLFGVLRETSMAQGWENLDERMFKKLADLVRVQAANRAFDLDRQT